MKASCSIGSLKLDPPLVNGSGVIDHVSGDAAWNLPASILSQLGAFTTKTITSTARAGSPQPWAEMLDDASLVNAAGLPNPGIDAAARDWSSLPEVLGVPIIASIGGSIGELELLAARIELAGWAAAIELNLSCPNVDGGLIAADADATSRSVCAARAVTALPIIAKLTPASGDRARIARAAVDAGADALTCGNTMPIRATHPATGAPLLGAGFDGGMSGHALLPISLRLVADVAGAVDVPIIALGGVGSPSDAQRMLDAGASIIGVGTGAQLDPSLIPRLAAWMSES